MILFIAPSPTLGSDGMLQRIQTIDEIFNNENKQYISSPLLFKIKKNRYNKLFFEFIRLISFIKLFFLILKSKKVYVHSIYYAKIVLPFYKLFSNKIITDLHGIVPEENESTGHHELAKKLQQVEEVVFKYGKYFVAVTQNMVDFYKQKYPSTTNTKQFIVLPIFDFQQNKQKHTDPTHLTFVYSGGTQQWQNIDLIVNTIQKLHHSLHFIILTPNPEVFKEKLNTCDIKNIQILSVHKNEVYQYYQQSDFGFILRDYTIVNRVACPTKLIEYLNNGIIPIVLQPEIGDFHRLGYSYILYEDILNMHFPNQLKIKQKQQNNFQVVNKLQEQTQAAIALLKEWVNHAF